MLCYGLKLCSKFHLDLLHTCRVYKDAVDGIFIYIVYYLLTEKCVSFMMHILCIRYYTFPSFLLLFLSDLQEKHQLPKTIPCVSMCLANNKLDYDFI